MTQRLETDTRERLLVAAADLIAASPGEDFSMRAVCEAAGVQMPTLYHFFGSKHGLVEAVIERGFDLFMSSKEAAEVTGDPIQDIRAGWDAHVSFGISNPGFYTIMYGKIRPGYQPAAQARPTLMLQRVAEQAEAQGRLVVSAEQATAHVLAASIGVTLHQISLGRPDNQLSSTAREGVIWAITDRGCRHANLVAQMVELASANRDRLGTPETQVLIKWLRQLESN